MDIQKQGTTGTTGTPDTAQLEKINALAKSPLRAEDVYVFSVRLCDDQLDRDYERFSEGALERLAPMFVGKTGIVDHDWSAERQVARVFECSCEREAGQTYLLAWAYMLRSEKTAALIAEIEGGIRREVSVGCAMGASRCSICGEQYGTCAHRKGERYGEAVCCAVLEDPIDAYEFSFVAVPAQPRAGVLKSWRAGGGSDGERCALESDAALGRQYLAELRRDFTRCALLLDLGLAEEELDALAGRMTPEELLRSRAHLAECAAQRYPLTTQLKSAGAAQAEKLGSEFLI